MCGWEGARRLRLSQEADRISSRNASSGEAPSRDCRLSRSSRRDNDAMRPPDLSLEGKRGAEG